MAALTTGAPVKWIDNLLSHHQLPGVEQARQGVQRRISPDGLLAIEIVRLLSREGGFAVGHAVRIVARAFDARDGTQLLLPIATGVQLRIDASEIMRRLQDRLYEAIDAAPRVRRGRPPSTA